MRVTPVKLLFQGTAGTRTTSCCFPSIAAISDSHLIATWRVGSSKDSGDGTIFLAESGDGGETWSEPRQPFGHQFAPGELRYAPITVISKTHLLAAVMWVDRSDASRPLFNPETEGLLETRTLIYRSTDCAKSWQLISEIDDSPYKSPLAITGPILKFGDRLACPFEVNKPYESTDPWRHAAAIKFSDDGGGSWQEAIEVANDPSGGLMFWDQRHAVRENECWATFWTFDRRTKSDGNIHDACSSDAGRTWTTPRDTGLTGQIAHPIWLQDGRRMLIYVDRFQTRSIRFAVESIQGAFNDAGEIYRHPHAATEAEPGVEAGQYLQDMNLWSFGRPDAVEFRRGFVRVIFYAGNASRTTIWVAGIEV
jgi:hypothetical protein